MATEAGKTFTACPLVYRLLKHANAKRILFLLDTKNLGEQAEQEFLRYQPTTITESLANAITFSGLVPAISLLNLLIGLVELEIKATGKQSFQFQSRQITTQLSGISS